MSRSIKKGIFLHQSIYNKLSKNNFKSWSRSSTIVPQMVGIIIYIHNGKIFNKLFVRENMIGTKLGEYSLTRKFKSHSKKIKLKKNVKK